MSDAGVTRDPALTISSRDMDRLLSSSSRLAVSGRFDKHLDPLFDGGHIKFCTVEALTSLLEAAGFEVPEMIRIDRIAPAANSVQAIARRPVDVSTNAGDGAVLGRRT